MSAKKSEGLSLLHGSGGGLNKTSSSRRRITSSIRSTSTLKTGVTKLRWWILFLYMFLGFSTMLQYSYVTVVPQMSKVYNVSSASINLCAAVGSFGFVILAFPGCKTVEVLGLRRSLLLAGVLILTGSGIKLLSILVNHAEPIYWILLLGNFFGAVPQCLLLGTPPLIASVWFPEDERTLATALGSLPNHIGFAANLLASPIIIQIAPSNDEKLGVIYMFLVQLAFSGFAFLAIVISFRSAPMLPPSITASSGQASRVDFLPSLKRCFLKSNFVLVILCMGISTGLFTTFIIMMAQLFDPFGIGENRIGPLGFSAEFSGIAATAVIGKVVDKLSQYGYKKPWLCLLGGQFFFFLILTLGSYFVAVEPHTEATSTHFYIWAFVFFLCTEVCIFPQYAVVMELAVETSYPEPPVIGGTAILLGVSLFQMIGNIAFSQFVGNKPTPAQVQTIFWFLLGICAMIGLTVFFFVGDDLARRRVQEETVIVNSDEEEEEEVGEEDNQAIGEGAAGNEGKHKGGAYGVNVA